MGALFNNQSFQIYTNTDPAPDLAELARAHGLEGEGPITDLADLPAALENALKRVHAGASFVLDVKVRQEYVTSSMAEMD